MAKDFTYRPDQKDDPGKYGSHPGDDLPQKGKGASLETLADYLSQLTKGKVEQGSQPSSPNAYTISPEAQDPGIITDGTVALTKPDTTQAKGEWFTSNQNLKADETMSTYSDSGIFGESLGDILNKSSQGKGLDSGNSLLADVKEVKWPPEPIPADFPEVQKKISDILKNNRFNPGPDSPYRADGEYTKGFYTIEQTFGEFSGDKYSAPGAANAGIESKFATEEGLKKIGKNLMINATGHGPMTIEIPFFDDLEIPGPSVDTPLLGDILLIPSPLQLGIMKVGTEKLRPGEHVGGSQQTGQVGGARKFDGVFNNTDRDSYGQLNSPWEPFAGPAPMAMAVTALAAMIAMKGLGFILDIIPLTSTAPDDPENDGKDANNNAAPHELKMGSSAHGNPDAPAQKMLTYLGIPATTEDIGDCVSTGIQSFFGMGSAPSEGDDASSLLDGAMNVIQSPGFYVVIIRNAIRDAEQVGKATSQADTGSVSGVAAAIVTVIDAIATSATFRFLMVMASLGEISNIARGGTNQYLAGGDLNSWHAPYNPSDAENPRTRAGKVRSEPGDSRLAYRHSAVPSLYLLPDSLAQLQVNLEGAGGGTVNLGVLQKTLGPETPKDKPDELTAEIQATLDTKSAIRSMWINSRPSPEIVHSFENHLDMEYVPFYFQDLRTNEFIALHSFLDSLTDSWAAEYTSSHGIGRMDAVMAHSKTTRTIALTFMLVATNEQDFDIMWWNVNKLVMMLYPQWSPGETVRGAEGERFTMPFSQVPTASPMVRLRVGDLIKSNYSDPAIARLFGASQKNTKDSETFRLGEEAKKTAKEAQEKLREKKEINAKVKEISDRHERGHGKPESMDNPGANGAKVDEYVIVKEKFYAKKKQGVPNGGILEVGGEIFNKDNKYWKQIKASGLPPGKADQSCKVEEVGTWMQQTYKKKTYYYLDFAFVDNDDFTTSVAYENKAERDADAESMGTFAYSSEHSEYLKHGKVSRIKYRVTVKCNFGTDEGVDVVVWGRAARTGLNKKWISDTATGMVDPAGIFDADSAGGVGDIKDFFNFAGDKNPIIRAFRSTRGRGLAGFITSMNMDWNEATWETEKLGKRAPKTLKISMNFAPVHDIPMGLDHEGFMRAPAYPVGDVVEAAFGDPWGDTELNTDRLHGRFASLRGDIPLHLKKGG